MTEVTVVHEDSYPVQWTGRQAVVTLPDHIDVPSADRIREELLSVINRGATALIMDMTAALSAATPARMRSGVPASVPSRTAHSCGWRSPPTSSGGR